MFVSESGFIALKIAANSFCSLLIVCPHSFLLFLSTKAGLVLWLLFLIFLRFNVKALTVRE